MRLQMLHRMPVNAIHQEVFLLAMGTQAAYRLAGDASQENYAEVYHYLLAQTLRMLYWYSDRTTAPSREINTLGMFQACATISYPALFENIEVLARLCPTFKRFPPSVALLRVFDHARKNNFYFFPRCFDAGRGALPLEYIPFENIPILEGPAPGSVGQEIYGSGWVFRACLIWEAFGYAEDRDIMVLNLDAFEERRQFDQGRLELTFIVFNGNEQVATGTAGVSVDAAIRQRSEPASRRNASESASGAVNDCNWIWRRMPWSTSGSATASGHEQCSSQALLPTVLQLA